MEYPSSRHKESKRRRKCRCPCHHQLPEPTQETAPVASTSTFVLTRPSDDHQPASQRDPSLIPPSGIEMEPPIITPEDLARTPPKEIPDRQIPPIPSSTGRAHELSTPKSPWHSHLYCPTEYVAEPPTQTVEPGIVGWETKREERRCKRKPWVDPQYRRMNRESWDLTKVGVGDKQDDATSSTSGESSSTDDDYIS